MTAIVHRPERTGEFFRAFLVGLRFVTKHRSRNVEVRRCPTWKPACEKYYF